MRHWPAIPVLALVLTGGLSACTGTEAAAREPVYRGGDPLGMGDDLYGFLVTMENAEDAAEVEDYVTCVVAGYAMEKEYGFARKLRVYVNEEGGVWSADAVYSITPTLPRGAKMIDAEVTAADCAQRGIPTV
ncbi:MAG: hypothetical protein WBB85_02915 [Albidovulum sp.]|uniref:hypothetical protein n=1 Tax=Albidovulum sp. TaxID=1872424 RepID=UPI003CB77F37